MEEDQNEGTTTEEVTHAAGARSADGKDHRSRHRGAQGPRTQAPGVAALESIYESALAIELRESEIPFERQVFIPILYRGVEIGLHRLDFFIEREIVVELKALRDIEDVHFAVVKSYLRAMRRSHGLILNFAKPTLEIQRVLAAVAP